MFNPIKLLVVSILLVFCIAKNPIAENSVKAASGNKTNFLVKNATNVSNVKVKSVNVENKTIIPAEWDSGRLTDGVKPFLYRLRFKLKHNFKDTEQFQGKARLTIQFLKSVKSFKFHGVGMNITLVKLDKCYYLTGYCHELSISHLSYSSNLEMYRIDLAKRIEKNNSTDIRYYLTIIYNGTLYRDFKGFHLQHYVNQQGQKVWMAVTQFKPTFARRAFPCFDEPNKKSQFDITIVRPQGLKSASNMPIRYIDERNNTFKEDVFHRSQIMSTYSLAFMVSNLVEKNDSLSGIRIWTRKDALKQFDFNSTFRTIRNLMYHCIKWSGLDDKADTNITQNDHVALPEHFMDATENWGLATYRECYLLDSAESESISESVISRQSTLMWLGNLVTYDWWDYLWLSEGFAKLFESLYKEKYEYFYEECIRPAMLVDGNNAKPLNSHAYSSYYSIMDKFDEITRYKGAVVLNMARKFSNDKTFRSVMKKYTSKNAFGNTMDDDLWQIFNETYDTNKIKFPAPFKTVMKTWTDQPGYPIITVNLNPKNSHVVISQRESKYKYYVEICYLLSKDLKNNNRSKVWLTPYNSTVELNYALNKTEWILINQQDYGYYRVKYKGILWDNLLKGIYSDNYKKSIKTINKVRIIDDAFNLLMDGNFDLFNFLKIHSHTTRENKEKDIPSIRAALEPLVELRRKYYNKKLIKDFLEDYAKTLIGKIYFRSVRIRDVDDDIRRILLSIMDIACEMGVKMAINDANLIFDDFKKNKTKMRNSQLRSSIFCNAIRNNKINVTNNWNYLWKLYNMTEGYSKKLIILQSFTCTEDRNLRTELFKRCFSKENMIMSFDVKIILIKIISKAPNGAEDFLSYLVKNFDKLIKNRIIADNLMEFLKYTARSITSDKQLPDLKKILNGRSLYKKSGMKSIAENLTRTVEENVRKIRKNYIPIIQHFQVLPEKEEPKTISTALRFKIDQLLIFFILLYQFS